MEILISFFILVIVSIPSHKVASYLQRFHLPLVSSLLLFGLLINPFGLDIVRKEHLISLDFVTEISLIFIALAAGNELYLKELKGRIKSIIRMCTGQAIGVFLCSLFGVYLALDYLPFVDGFSFESRWGIALLFASIFVARSPSTMIAIVGELRAKGPFTQMALGVTVLMDAVVIILFTICLEFSMAMARGISIDYTFILLIFLGILLSCAIGIFFGRLISFLLARAVSDRVKLSLLFLLAFFGYHGIHWLGVRSVDVFGKEVYMESLLVFIVSGFYMVNYSKYRYEFATLLERVLPYIYVVFFTLTGLTMSLDKLVSVGAIAVLFALIRFVAIFLGSVFGSIWAREPRRFTAISWMPHITQAGIALGLAKVVESKFTWGTHFSTVVIALLIVNQLVGPLFLKWSIQKAGESYVQNRNFAGRKHVLLFGLETLSLALARQLVKNGYKVDLVSLLPEQDLQQLRSQYQGVLFHQLSTIDRDSLSTLPLKTPEKIILLFSDKKNKNVCELLRDKFIHAQWVVRLNDRAYLDYFHSLEDALIVEPSMAMVNLFDQFVRSPEATSLLLGMEPGQGTLDVEARNPEIFGVALRDLRLPKDIIILSIKRGGQHIISHGFTRIQKGDHLTLVGDKEELEKLTVKFS